MAYGATLNQTMTQAAMQQQQQQQPAVQVSEEEMIQFIVENVNQVLTRSYSLVDFDSLQGPKLLQVLSDIFGNLAPHAAVDFSTAPLDQGSQQLQDFLLKTLGYKIPPFVASTFQQSFTVAQPTVIYPILYWVLKHMPQNVKRVYLARFLQRLEIPDDLRMQDEGVRDLCSHYESLRTDFVQTHKRVDALREAHADPAEARRKIQALEDERDKLNSYISAAQKKLSNVPNKDSLLSACKALRVEQDEANKLAEKRVEQQQQLVSAQRRNTEITNRLANVRRDQQIGRVDDIVRRLRDEIITNQMKLQEQLPKEINEKRVENAALQKLVSEPLDFSSLHAEMGQLDNQVRILAAQVAERQKVGDDGSSVVSVKQQVQRVVKRKQEILGELNGVQQENERLLQELREKERAIAQHRDSKVLKGDDFRKYAGQVRAKATATKSMKTRLSDLRAEWGVLSYTEKTIKSQFETLRQEVEEIESRMGIRGYSQTAESLSRVSDQKNAVEQVKGKTLEELSKVVQEFTVSIRERRSKLAPQINELRTVRQAAAEVDQEWEERKSQFEYQEGMLMQDVTKIDAEVNSLSEECRVNEALYHRLQSQLVLVEAQLARAQDERDFKNGQRTFDAEFRTLTDHFTRTTEKVEQRAKYLQRKRREIEENHGINVQQVEWFAVLKKILEGKLNVLKNSPQQPLDQVDKDIQSVMMSGGANRTAGVDMLVLGNN